MNLSTLISGLSLAVLVISQLGNDLQACLSLPACTDLSLLFDKYMFDLAFDTFEAGKSLCTVEREKFAATLDNCTAEIEKATDNKAGSIGIPIYEAFTHFCDTESHGSNRYDLAAFLSAGRKMVVDFQLPISLPNGTLVRQVDDAQTTSNAAFANGKDCLCYSSSCNKLYKVWSACGEGIPNQAAGACVSDSKHITFYFEDCLNCCLRQVSQGVPLNNPADSESRCGADIVDNLKNFCSMGSRGHLGNFESLLNALLSDSHDHIAHAVCLESDEYQKVGGIFGRALSYTPTSSSKDGSQLSTALTTFSTTTSFTTVTRTITVKVLSTKLSTHIKSTGLSSSIAAIDPNTVPLVASIVGSAAATLSANSTTTTTVTNYQLTTVDVTVYNTYSPTSTISLEPISSLVPSAVGIVNAANGPSVTFIEQHISTTTIRVSSLAPAERTCPMPSTTYVTVYDIATISSTRHPVSPIIGHQTYSKLPVEVSQTSDTITSTKTTITNQSSNNHADRQSSRGAGVLALAFLAAWV